MVIQLAPIQPYKWSFPIQNLGFHRQRGVLNDAVCYLLFKHSVFVLTLFHQHALLDGLCSHVTFCELR